MQATITTTEEVLNHHLEAFMNNNLDELMKDYTEASEIWTPDGAISGLEAISSFFSYVFTLLPTGSALELKFKIIKDEKIYIVWSADSDFISIPFASDSFIITGGKIIWQTTAAQIIPKQ